MCSLPRKLAEHHGKGYVIAPAGFGKTYLIANAVKHGTARQLVLTHTYAGVNALKRKMRLLGVPESRFHIDTIASWSLRSCLSYPLNSGWTIEQPNGDDWTRLYTVTARLLEKLFIRKIIKASYAGVYVDEYQDCSTSQHGLVTSLSEILPTRLVGDPLQGIFDFDGDPVDWDAHVFPHFEHLGCLTTPWRWRNAGATEIGDWLVEVRDAFEHGRQIDLSAHLPDTVRYQAVNTEEEKAKRQYNTCSFFKSNTGENVIAIHKGTGEYKNKCHELARRLSGRFSSIEEIEGAKLFSFVREIDSARTARAKLKCAINFAAAVMTGVKAELPAATRRGEMAPIAANTKNPELASVANRFLENDTTSNLEAFIVAVKEHSNVHPYRRDLLNRVLQVLRLHSQSAGTTLKEVADQYQREFRHRGRPVAFPKLIGTTLLVKGLEFDHAIILDAASLSTKELYVALTRGAKSVTIISAARLIPNARC